jgi:hypothetical protein
MAWTIIGHTVDVKAVCQWFPTRGSRTPGGYNPKRLGTNAVVESCLLFSKWSSNSLPSPTFSHSLTYNLTHRLGLAWLETAHILLTFSL